jgi:hypothetical protein
VSGPSQREGFDEQRSPHEPLPAPILSLRRPLRTVPPGPIGLNQYHQGPGIHRKLTNIGGQIVDDSRCLRFFLEPTDALHRRYEALRAYFVERCPLDEIARRSGYSYNQGLRTRFLGDLGQYSQEIVVLPSRNQAPSGDTLAFAGLLRLEQT